MFKRISILMYALAMTALLGVDLLGLWPAVASEGKTLEVGLSRSPFDVHEFPARTAKPTAILLFGSGDGGWGDFEEAICQAFQNHGFVVMGIDCEAYAQTDYNLSILQADFNKIAQTAQAASGDRPPVIVGGYSMGAAQAIAVAGGPHPPRGLVGLLLVDPCSRGRYGLRSSDQMNVLPNGPGTFGVADFANTMNSLRVVQWHASEDEIDSRTWLDSLKAEHESFTFPDNGHQYENNRPDFIAKLVASADWILAAQGKGAAAAPTKAGP